MSLVVPRRHHRLPAGQETVLGWSRGPSRLCWPWGLGWCLVSPPRRGGDERRGRADRGRGHGPFPKMKLVFSVLLLRRLPGLRPATVGAAEDGAAAYLLVALALAWLDGLQQVGAEQSGVGQCLSCVAEGQLSSLQDRDWRAVQSLGDLAVAPADPQLDYVCCILHQCWLGPPVLKFFWGSSDLVFLVSLSLTSWLRPPAPSSRSLSRPPPCCPLTSWRRRRTCP